VVQVYRALGGGWTEVAVSTGVAESAAGR